MKDLEQELKDLAKETEEKRKALLLKYEVLAKLPNVEEYYPPSVHTYGLHGSVGSIHFRMNNYASLKGKSPDSSLLRTLLAAIPPVDTVKWEEGCTSFRPEPDSYESNGNVVEVDPILLTLDPNTHSDYCEVNWYGKLGEEIWRIAVQFPLRNPAVGKLGKLKLRPRYLGDQVTSWEQCEFEPKDHTVNVIRWASGGKEYANHFTIYWDRGRNIDIPALLES